MMLLPASALFLGSREDLDALTQIRADCNSLGYAPTFLEKKLFEETNFSNDLFTHLHPTY